MATTGNNFAKIGVTTLSGTAVLAGATTPFVEAISPGTATNADGGATVVDRVIHDLSLTAIPASLQSVPFKNTAGTHIGAFAKNGCALLALSGTTPQTVDLTDLTANTPASYAGDTGFSTANTIIFNNLGAGAVTVSTGATNPAGLPTMGSTSSGVTVPANSILTVHSKAGVTVDSTHKNIVCTPAATTTFCVSIGGA